MSIICTYLSLECVKVVTENLCEESCFKGQSRSLRHCAGATEPGLDLSRDLSVF